MILIHCPACEAGLRLEASKLAKRRRGIRCAVCNHRWIEAARPQPASSPESDPAPQVRLTPQVSTPHAAPDVTPEPRGGPGSGMKGLGISARPGFEWPKLTVPEPRTIGPKSPDLRAETAPGTRRQRKSANKIASPARSTGFRRGAEQLAVACAVLVLVQLGLGKRDVVVRFVPKLAGIYSAIGLPVNLQGLELVEVKSRLLEDAAQPVLAVEGEIRNLRDKSQKIPELQLSLRDASGREVYVWKTQPPKGDLAGGETVYFRARLEAPPDGANRVHVQFADLAKAPQHR